MSTSFDLDTMICVLEIFAKNQSTLEIIAWGGGGGGINRDKWIFNLKMMASQGACTVLGKH
jgi:hypothetical protein